MAEGIKMWHEDERVIRIRPGKVVNKLYRDGKFYESIILPTALYPLTGEPQVFTYANTTETENARVLELFDSVQYRIGHCYDNAAELAKKLREAGFEPETYAGWLFTGEGQLPVHHCWVVLGDSLLDLSDDAAMLVWSGVAEQMKAEEDKDAIRERLAEYMKEALTWPNSKRCSPVGQASPNMLYVGSPCSPEEAIRTCRQLMQKYPDHETQRNCKGERINPTQKYFLEKGIGKFE